jgi:serine/threonine protein kinase/Flp pilus assembly protein TadD
MHARTSAASRRRHARAKSARRADLDRRPALSAQGLSVMLEVVGSTLSTSVSDDGELAPGPFSIDAGPLAGQLLGGRYRVIERLAEGGMGTVYRAEHVALHKEVAIKLVQDGANSDHAMRFLREAMLTSRIDHPNVVSALDYGTFDDGTAYLVMGLCEGPTLAHVMYLERPMSWVRAAEIGAQIADAVAAAQAQGIVHRDLKPENVVLQPMPDGTDVVKVLDFGIAKYARDSLVPPDVVGSQFVTRMGVVVGTPGYMAPEQAVGIRADHRADLYAIGILLWECVVGRRLWDFDDIQALLTAQLGHRPPLLREETGDPTIPEAFEALVAALLAPRPEMRPQSAVETRDRLLAIVEAELRESQPRLQRTAAAQPSPIAMMPPPPTSTVFIGDALARWRAAAGASQRHVDAAGEPVREPTTQIGFRSQPQPEPQPPTSAATREERVPQTASEPVQAAHDDEAPADVVAAIPRVSSRWFVAVPLALAIVIAAFWAALAPDPSTARSAAASLQAPHARAKRDTASAPRATPTTRVQSASAAAAADTVPSAGPANATPPPSLQPANPAGAALSATALGPRPATKRARSSAATAAPRTSRPRGHADALRAEARAHFARAEFALAAQAYRAAIKAAPGYAGAYAGLGASLFALGDTHGAIAAYAQATRRSPSSSGFHAALGRVWLVVGDRARALAEYRIAVALDPSNEVASNALARLAGAG